jgi:hypothetical protein
LKIPTPILLAFPAATSATIACHVDAIGTFITSGFPFPTSGKSVQGFAFHMTAASGSISPEVREMLYGGQLDEAVIYQIKIHIIRSKVFQRLFKCWSYVIWIMSCIPEFARDLSSHIPFSYLSKRSIPKWFLRIVPSVECQML